MKRFKRRKIAVIVGLSLAALVCCGLAALHVYANWSMAGDEELAQMVDEAIQKSLSWVRTHKPEIIETKNMALFYMLKDARDMCDQPVFSEIVDSLLHVRTRPDCWKRMIWPEHPVSRFEINPAIDREVIDNKWILYAIAPQTA